MEPLIVELGKLGLAGAFLIYLVLQNRGLTQELKWTREQLVAVQEKRVGEVAENVKALGTVAHSNDRMAAALADMADALNARANRR